MRVAELEKIDTLYYGTARRFVRPQGGSMMEIRNIMEEAVRVVVEELFETEKGDKRLGFCTCDQCKLDVECYVLNRVKPEYIVSSRGLAYSEKEGLDKVQRRADVISLVKEGWGKVSHRPRPTSDHLAAKPSGDNREGPVFNFPTIMGRVFDGRTFAPLSEGAVRLLSEGEEAEMLDPNWQNPFVLAGATGGTFIFWPKPKAAEPGAEERKFVFEIKVEVPSLEGLSHYVELNLSPERSVRLDFSLQRVYKIPDLYLFPVGQDEEDQ
jgi:competence protein ComFB